MSKQKLETIIGTLADSFKKVNPSTIQHSYEIMKMNERRTDESLRNHWFYTADFNLYSVENGKVFLYMATRENNLIFKHINEATKQIIEESNYFPTKEEADKVVKTKSTIKINISELILIKDNNEWSHLNISTTKYDKLNKTERALAERVYGQEKDFKKNMEMLNKAGIKETRIYVLNESYVKANAKNDYLGRASRLDGFNYDSRFDACDGFIRSGSALRGVSKEKAEGRKKTDININKYEEAYKVLSKNKKKAVENMTSHFAETMSNILTKYLAKQKQ